MSASPLLRLSGRHHQDRNGKPIHWQRVGVDGAPYRGEVFPLMPDAEWDERTTRVADPRNAFFDVQDPDQNREFLGVLDAACNGWYQILFIDRFWNGTTKHYVEWVEYYLEDGTRTPIQPGAATHGGNRNGNGQHAGPPPGR